MKDDRHFGRWTKTELRQAEATASRFLHDNSTQIAEAMHAKMGFLEELIRRLSGKEISFEQRLDYLARASEIARLIQADADGFFHLASQPMIARLVGSVPPNKARGKS
jgi:hypothetical protein